MPQSFVCLNCHIVFSTKNREPWIECPMADRLYAYLGGILRGEGATLLAAGGTPDHVHLLASLGKLKGVADLMREVKANSSKWVHETFGEMKGFAWQTGYGAFGVSCSQLEQVKCYLASQQEHHRVRTFKEEFIVFLVRHGIEYDERYLWD